MSSFSPRFSGVYHVRIDSKRRIKLPSKYLREDIILKDEFSIFADPTKPAIVVYDSDHLPIREGSDINLELAAAFISAASLDNTGRILLPKPLANIAKLRESGDAVIAGAGDYFEIWVPRLWNKEVKRRIDLFDEPHQD